MSSDGSDLRVVTRHAHDRGMNTREIVVRIVAPDDPALARRILALLWAYERAALRHRLFHEPLQRRIGERAPQSHGRLGPQNSRLP